MTSRNDRAKRIVRVRSAQHRIAGQQLGQARLDAQQIGSVVERIDALRKANQVAQGASDGPSLAAMSEWLVRLDSARQSTAASLEQAFGQIERHQEISAHAQLKLDCANRRLEKAERTAAADAEQRATVTRAFRPQMTAGSPS
jgi:exonuclease VII small subunit